MPETYSIDLRGGNFDTGPVHFLRAEWQVPGSRFVILRYAVGNYEERPFGLRLDLDKQAILDDIEELGDEQRAAVRARAGDLWKFVIAERRERRQMYA